MKLPEDGQKVLIEVIEPRIYEAEYDEEGDCYRLVGYPAISYTGVRRWRPLDGEWVGND